MHMTKAIATKYGHRPLLPLVTLSEDNWRSAAALHRDRVKTLLQPGLLPQEETGKLKNRKRHQQRQEQQQKHDSWTGLDPVNPIYNFLIEYYGIKGSKGTRRLARWSPDPSLLLLADTNNGHKSNHDAPPLSMEKNEMVYEAAMKASNGLGGIFLENAKIDDMGGTLHLRGAIPVPSLEDPNLIHGVIYNPAIFYGRYDRELLGDGQDENGNNDEYDDRRSDLLKKIAPFQWYKSIMETTLESEPILHCHGLHEWAMLYHPPGAPPPPSSKYQASLPLRVSRRVINETVERKGIHCTHVDALRFFAPAAAPLNHHGSSLERIDQLRLEQKACVHAHMDLLKIALKLQPFVSSDLLVDVLKISLKARTLDVEASPYDATAYGAGIVPVETPEGRKMYRDKQRALMEEAEPVRLRLLQAYETFMNVGFDEEMIKACAVEKRAMRSGKDNRSDHQQTVKSGFAGQERFARAEPGGLPWRKNLIETK